MARFDKYVHSPFFTVHRDTILLFDVIKQAYPNPGEGALEAKKIYAKIYPNTPYNDNKVRTLRKYLLKLLLTFLAQIELEEDEWGLEWYQVRALFNRGLHKYFVKHIEEAERHLKTYPYQNLDSLLHNFHLESLKVGFKISREGRFGVKKQEKVMQSLDYFYFAAKFNFFNSLLSNQSVPGSNEQSHPMLREITSYCEANLEQLPLIVQIYFHMTQLDFELGDNVHYHKIKILLPLSAKVLDKSDQINIYNKLLNYCNAQYQKGEISYLKEMFDFYREMLDKDLLFDEGIISSHYYKNITTLGLRLAEFEWTEDFIRNYKDQIDEEYRQGVYSYNMAHFFAYKKDYSESLKYLQQVDFIDPFYRISYNLLLLKIYYECKYVESFLALCTSFKIFIRRKKELTEAKRDAYLNFIKFSKALFNTKIKGKSNLAKVAREIEEASSLIEKEWLLEKMEEF